MIISASRRTDIPAFYAEWFINRIRAGFCTVPNPFNRAQVSSVSLLPEDVDAIVFWTRNPRPLFPYLNELDERGYRCYFQYTILDNPREIDPKSPPADAAIRAFCELSDRIGPLRVIWRYDPIVLSDKTGVDFHVRAYQQIAQALSGQTRRSVISVMDHYTKARGRLGSLSRQGYTLFPTAQVSDVLPQLIPPLVSAAAQAAMEIVSCAEDLDLACFGVRPGKCVDDGYIKSVFGIDVTGKKDPSQRKACGCVVSKDIGMYDSCLFGCQYCYATQSFDLARSHHSKHNPQSPSLVGWYEPTQTVPIAKLASKVKHKKGTGQLNLFDET